MVAPRPSDDAVVIARWVAARTGERAERVRAKRERLREALPRLADLLVERGARRVWLFGSLAWGEPHAGSDIDLAVEGLPGDALLDVQGLLLLAAPGSVDLVRLEEAPEPFAQRIRTNGELLRG